MRIRNKIKDQGSRDFVKVGIKWIQKKMCLEKFYFQRNNTDKKRKQNNKFEVIRKQYSRKKNMGS